MIFEGDDVSTQRIKIEAKSLNPLEPKALFVDIYHRWGDDSITLMSFTPEEGRFVLNVLRKIYPNDNI